MDSNRRHGQAIRYRMHQCRCRRRWTVSRYRSGCRIEYGVIELCGTPCNSQSMSRRACWNETLERSYLQLLSPVRWSLLAKPYTRQARHLFFRFAHSLRYELRDTGVSVTALQPGPTDTDFFHRAGMDDTEVGSRGKSESEPDDVARQGIDALLAGKDHVYSASLKTKIEGMLANAVPGVMKGAMHEKMAKPLREK